MKTSDAVQKDGRKVATFPAVTKKETEIALTENANAVI